MTTIYTGSNYGIISTLNSGSGTINALTSNTYTFELCKNYTSGSILIDLSGNALTDITIEYSNDNIGTIVSTDTRPLIKSGTYTFDFKPQGQYFRIRLTNTSTTIPINFTLQTRLNNSNDPLPEEGVLSPNNSILRTSLDPSSTVSGEYEDVTQYSLITLLANGSSVTPPASCTIECIFSMDGINEDRIVSYNIQDLTANGSSSSTTSLTFNPAHTLLPIARYFKVRLTNGPVALTSLRLSIVYHTQKSKPLTSRVTQGLSDQFDADTARSILVGRTLGTILPQGTYQNIGVQNQSLSTFIREPTTAFGEVLTANLTPIIQFDFSNGTPTDVMAPIYRNSLTTSSYNYANSSLTLTADASNSIIQAFSSEYTKYKAGQGIDARFTNIFNSSQAVQGSSQYAGLFTPENSLTFGYFDASGFCIRYGKNGIQQIVRMSISGSATSTSTIQINMGGTTITTATITSGSNALVAAYAITNVINNAIGLNIYDWKVSYYTVDGGTTATVELVRSYADSNITISVTTPQIGYTLTSTNYRSGSPTQYTYIQQNDWNINTCKDMGSLQQNYLRNATGFILNPNYGNVYRIVFQYLGFGAITFYIENPETGVFLPVHQIKYANSNTTTSVSSPNYKLGYGVENTTNNSSVSIKGFSASAFVQGIYLVTPLYRSYPNVIAGNTYIGTISKANARVIFGFRVTKSKQSTNSTGPNTITLNRSNLFLNSMSCSLNVLPPNQNTQVSASVIYQIVKNPTSFYIGNPTTTPYIPPWRISEQDSTLEVFDGKQILSDSSGICYTGGVNVFDIPLVENTATTYDLRQTLINISPDDVFIVSAYGTAAGNSSKYDLLATISYQVNN
jgi:hypothetical protein